jgi:hypothetical protein
VVKSVNRSEDSWELIFFCLLSDLWKRDGPVPRSRWERVVYLWAFLLGALCSLQDTTLLLQLEKYW